MRPIKFRCWYGGKMYPISILQNGYAADVLDTDWEKREAEVGMLELETPVMQFTGLHDKNGKEIYEGDVIHLKHETGFNEYDESKEVVKFEMGGFTAGIYADPNDECDCEVIGNIYENPELIKTI